MPKAGWLDKQMKKNLQEVEHWPRWMKDTAIRIDAPASRKDESKKSNCSNTDKEASSLTA